jgi:hypothetical protein
MKDSLARVGLNELLCWSAMCRRAERLRVLGGNVIADAECHAFSCWVDSTRMTVQPATRIIPSTLHSHNRGAAGSFFDSMRSGDITPELTGEQSMSSLTDLLIASPVE